MVKENRIKIDIFKAEDANKKSNENLSKRLEYERNDFVNIIYRRIKTATAIGEFSTDKDYEKRLGKDFLDNIKNQLTNSGYIVKDNNDGTWKIKG